MQQQGSFTLFDNINEFAQWLYPFKTTRQINVLQVHHTYSPSYKDFNGNNHFELLQAMKDYHVNVMHYQDIAQNLTTFCDGKIALCRSLNIVPAGIKGCNGAGICVENLGNFDIGGDAMTDIHHDTIIALYAVLCTNYKLTPSTDSLEYHHWWDLDTGIRTNGTGDVKTCPGTGFFGGNTIEAAQANFIPLITAALNGGVV